MAYSSYPSSDSYFSLRVNSMYQGMPNCFILLYIWHPQHFSFFLGGTRTSGLLVLLTDFWIYIDAGKSWNLHVFFKEPYFGLACYCESRADGSTPSMLPKQLRLRRRPHIVHLFPMSVHCASC